MNVGEAATDAAVIDYEFGISAELGTSEYLDAEVDIFGVGRWN